MAFIWIPPIMARGCGACVDASSGSMERYVSVQSLAKARLSTSIYRFRPPDEDGIPHKYAGRFCPVCNMLGPEDLLLSLINHHARPDSSGHYRRRTPDT